jgi:hypothetical protein
VYPRLVAGFEFRLGNEAFAVDKLALSQGFSEYFLFPLPIIPPTAPHSLFGAGTVGLIVGDVPSGLSLTLLYKLRKLACICTIGSGHIAGQGFSKAEDVLSSILLLSRRVNAGFGATIEQPPSLYVSFHKIQFDAKLPVSSQLH